MAAMPALESVSEHAAYQSISQTESRSRRHDEHTEQSLCPKGSRLVCFLTVVVVGATFFVVLGTSQGAGRINAECSAHNVTCNLEDTQDAENASWVLACSFLVFLMTPGFMMLEYGACGEPIRPESSQHAPARLDVLKLKIIGLITSAISFFVLGYDIMVGFDPKSCSFSSFWEEPSNCMPFFFKSMAGLDVRPIELGEVASWLYHFMLASNAATIVTGAVLARISLNGYVISTAMISGVIHPLLARLVWSPLGGLFTSSYCSTPQGGGNDCPGLPHRVGNGYIDYAGGVVVHMLGGTAALVAACILQQGDLASTHVRRKDTHLSVLGTMLLFFGWFGFNSGTAGGTTYSRYMSIVHICVSLLLSGTVSGLVVFLLTARTLFARVSTATRAAQRARRSMLQWFADEDFPALSGVPHIAADPLGRGQFYGKQSGGIAVSIKDAVERLVAVYVHPQGSESVWTLGAPFRPDEGDGVVLHTALSSSAKNRAWNASIVAIVKRWGARHTERPDIKQAFLNMLDGIISTDFARTSTDVVRCRSDAGALRRAFEHSFPSKLDHDPDVKGKFEIRRKRAVDDTDVAPRDTDARRRSLELTESDSRLRGAAVEPSVLDTYIQDVLTGTDVSSAGLQTDVWNRHADSVEAIINLFREGAEMWNDAVMISLIVFQFRPNQHRGDARYSYDELCKAAKAALEKAGSVLHLMFASELKTFVSGLSASDKQDAQQALHDASVYLWHALYEHDRASRVPADKLLGRDMPLASPDIEQPRQRQARAASIAERLRSRSGSHPVQITDDRRSGFVKELHDRIVQVDDILRWLGITGADHKGVQLSDLETWIHEQRLDYGTLEPEKINRLAELGFFSSSSSSEAGWRLRWIDADINETLNGVLTGLVASTACGNVLPISMSVLFVGPLAGLAYFAGRAFERIHGIEDTLAAFPVHGLGGFVGGMLSALAAFDFEGRDLRFMRFYNHQFLDLPSTQLWIQFVGTPVIFVALLAVFSALYGALHAMNGRMGVQLRQYEESLLQYQHWRCKPRSPAEQKQLGASMWKDANFMRMVTQMERAREDPTLIMSSRQSARSGGAGLRPRGESQIGAASSSGLSSPALPLGVQVS